MSYANGTQFYNLPQTVGTDKRDWFDANAAFAAVDAALHAAATGQAADAEAIAAINTSLTADEANIASLQTASTTHSSEISALQATVASQGTAIGDVRQDAEDMISAFNEGAASVSTHAYAIGDYFIYNDVLYKATAAIAIGDTIVPNTNCSATNVTSEIKVINADIDEVKSDLTETVIYSAQGDGVKTRGQLLNEIYNNTSASVKSDMAVHPKRYSIKRTSNEGVLSLSINDVLASEYRAGSIVGITDQVMIIGLRIAATDSDYNTAYINTNGATYTDSSSTVATSDYKLELVKSV